MTPAEIIAAITAATSLINEAISLINQVKAAHAGNNVTPAQVSTDAQTAAQSISQLNLDVR